MTLNKDRYLTFGQAYLDGLTKAVSRPGSDYAYPVEDVPMVCNRMLGKMATSPMSVNYNSEGLKNACKTIGIKYTRQAIIAYLFG